MEQGLDGTLCALLWNGVGDECVCQYGNGAYHFCGWRGKCNGVIDKLVIV